MNKKGIIIAICVLIFLFIASLVTKYIDTANVSTGHEPKCCIKIVSKDGGKVTYWGLGYKVIRYVGVSHKEPYKNNIGVKMGSWFMKYEKPSDDVLNLTDSILKPEMCVYIYEESVEEMSKPYLALDKENKEFRFFWSVFSSYIAQGTYEVDVNKIICKTDDGNNVYTFEILEGEGYKFIESKSSKIPKYKYSSDAKEAFAPVVDGAVFD